MVTVIGIILLLAMVFGGFAITGGDLGPVFHAIPHEMLIIGGAAAGALVIGNNVRLLKALGGGVVKAFKGPAFKPSDYLDCIFLCARLMRALKVDGAVALEAHIEDPASSELFAAYPRLLRDKTLVHLITDTLRLSVISSGNLDLQAVEDIMDQSLRLHHQNAMKPAEMLQTMGDALPALGIVAAVLGVVKTMGSIDKPPAILGGMIGSALVGTFLGVLLAYGIVSPLANRLKGIIDEEAEMYHIAKQIILASLRGYPQPLVIEAARTAISHHNQPSFAAVFDGMRAK